MAQQHFANAVIPKFIPAINKTAFFFADAEPSNGEVEALIDGEGVKMMTMEEYRKADLLHPEDVNVALEIYKKQTGVEPVLRERMPYKKNKKLEKPRRLSVDTVVEAAKTEQNPDTKHHLEALAEQMKEADKVANEQLVATASFQEATQAEAQPASASVPPARKVRKKSKAKSLAAKARWARIKAEKAAMEQVEQSKSQVVESFRSAGEGEAIDPQIAEQISKQLTQIILATLQQGKKMH